VMQRGAAPRESLLTHCRLPSAPSPATARLSWSRNPPATRDRPAGSAVTSRLPAAAVLLPVAARLSRPQRPAARLRARRPAGRLPPNSALPQRSAPAPLPPEFAADGRRGQVSSPANRPWLLLLAPREPLPLNQRFQPAVARSIVPLRPAGGS